MMKDIKILLFLIAASVLYPYSSTAQESALHTLYINEVMQSTFNAPLDNLMEIPDGWVEIYNPGNVSVSLKGYHIGKKKKFSKGYELPDCKVPARGFLVIYCDKEDTYLDKYKEIHTDFRLSNDEDGYVYLYNASAELVDSMIIPAMPAPNVSYGRLTEGSDQLGYQLKSTRGAKNCGTLAKGVLPSPTFSTNSYLVSAGQGQEVIRCKVFIPKSAPAETVIRYTTDGKDPTSSSPVLDGPLYFSQNTILKAALFADGYVTPPFEERVFLFHGRDITLPVVSVTTLDEYIYDNNIGLYPNNSETQNNHNWKRSATLDYFPVGASAASLTQKCEVRLGGAYTRGGASLKTMICYANKRFGTNDYFTAQFWPDSRPEVLFSPSIALRNSGNDFGYTGFRDAVAQTVMGLNSDLDWQAAQPCIYYLNGVYKGLLNIRERSNEDNVWTHYGIEDITCVENSTLKTGDWSQYSDFLKFIAEKGHTYDDFDKIMDIKEYTNMMIMEIYQSNTDFPGNNTVCWRPLEEGGKWRWILKDTDFGFNIWNARPYDYNYLNWVTGRGEYSGFTGASEENSRLFRRLLDTPEYQELFVDMFSVYLGDFMTGDYFASVIDWFKDAWDPEYPSFQAVQGVRSYSSWESEVKSIKDFAKKRSPEMYRQLKNFFSLGDAVPVTINQDVVSATKYTVTVNGINLATHSFDGNLYRGKVYTIDGSYDDDNYELLGWDVVTTYTSGKTETVKSYGRDVEIEIAKGVASISVNAIRGVSGVETPETVDLPVARTIYYNAMGVSQDVPFNGLNIVKYIFEDGTSATVKKMITK